MSTLRYLIIGAGYIGSHLYQHAQEQVTTITSRTAVSNIPASRQLCGDFFTLSWDDILNQYSPDVIFHCLGTSPQAEKSEQEKCHLDSLQHLMEAINKNNRIPIPSVVLIGSAAEYGLKSSPAKESDICYPQTVYGQVKHQQSQLARQLSKQYNVPLIIARIFNIYGSGPPALSIASIIQKLLRATHGKPESSLKHIDSISLHNINSQRDFIYVDDAMKALQQLATLLHNKPQYGDIYNIATGHATSLQTVFELLCHKLSIHNISAKSPNVVLEGEQQANCSVASIQKICAHTTWQPETSLSDGLDKEISYWQNKLQPIH